MTEMVLIVDDDPIQRRLLDAQVSRMGLTPLVCSGGAAALTLLRAKAQEIGAMVLDLVMPDLGGLEVLREMDAAGIQVPVVVQTAKGSLETVVEAMRAGAFDFVVKPASPERMALAIDAAVRLSRAGGRAHAAGAASQALPDRRPLDMPDAGPAMRPLLAMAERAAGSSIPLLIGGETGVGKEWLARAIHAAGPRASRPFVAVNCGAVPADLVESILFGHAKGAFTDAREAQPGRFVEADGGTLLLDEIAELPLAAQVKLLRVLQDGAVDPVGARGSVAVDVRVVSATNGNLAAAVETGTFRQDLYYRLAVLELTVPPLRERREEIAPLARSILARHARDGRGFHLDAQAGALLEAYDWPGNIRQLQNVLHRAAVLADAQVLTVEDFPQVRDAIGVGGEARAKLPPAGRPGAEADRETAVPARGAGGLVLPIDLCGPDGEIRTLEAVEGDVIRAAIARYRGRMSETARRLGIGRSTLYRKMRDHKIDLV